MSGSTAWPGQQIAWPGQEITTEAAPKSWAQTLGSGAETITTPEAQAADQATSQTAPSLEDIRGGIQETDRRALEYLKPPPDAGPLERGVKLGSALAVHLGANLAQFPINALIGITQQSPQIDPDTGRLIAPGATINRETGNYELSPELQAAGSLAAFPLRFSGTNALMRAPPPTLGKPLPVTVDELRAAITRAGEQPAPGGPTAPAATEGSTQSVGAAASREGTPASELNLTPKQEQAYRSTAEGQKLLETQQPGLTDQNQYVRGVQPNTAEIEQTAQAARELKTLNNANPEVKQELAVVADANNAARKEHFDQLAGSKVTLRNAIDARDAQATADLEATWANKQDVSPQSVVDAANQIKQTEDGRRPAVRRALDSVTNELRDENGNLITDPQLLYGVRKHIDDLLSKEGAQTDPLAMRAKANLLALKDSLDGVISAGAPGFRTYLERYNAASRPIDEMTALQGYETGLYNGQGRMEHNRVQRMMRDILDSRGSPGLNPEKSISDETMQQLWALRNDLRRSSAAVELARASGSDSAQNLMDLMKRGTARGFGGLAGGTVGGWFGGPAGAAGGASLGQKAADSLLTGRAAKRDLQRGMEMIYPPRNTMMPPD